MKSAIATYWHAAAAQTKAWKNACNGTAPVEVSSENRKACRLSLRGNAKLVGGRTQTAVRSVQTVLVENGQIKANLHADYVRRSRWHLYGDLLEWKRESRLHDQQYSCQYWRKEAEFLATCIGFDSRRHL